MFLLMGLGKHVGFEIGRAKLMFKRDRMIWTKVRLVD